jgi:hypothetical protein
LQQTWAKGVLAIDVEEVIEHLTRPVEVVTDASEFSNCTEGLLVVSANVQSLRGQVSTKHTKSERISVFKLPGNKKLDLVLHQFKAKRVHLGGLQEVRAFKTSKRMAGDFVYCTSEGTKKGSHGCGMVFNTSIPWAWQGQQPCMVGLKDVEILHAESRLLICSIDAPGCNLVFHRRYNH